MIKRIVFLLVLAMATPLASGAFANPYADSAVSQLRQQGFQSIVVKRTLLGRIKIRATQSESVREIIIHPVTGEVLRDYWIVYAGTDGDGNAPPPAIDPDDDGDSHGGNDGSGDDGGNDNGNDNGNDGSGDDGDSSGNDDNNSGGNGDGNNDGGDQGDGNDHGDGNDGGDDS